MIHGQPKSPEWKVLWDRARSLAHDENYLLAVKTYSDLYNIKPNIEEANWEYCKVLLKVEDFSTAAKIVGGLLDDDPNNGDYLMASGAISMHWENYEAAARYYGRVFEKDPTGINADSALLGLATSLQNQGKKELAFTLLEQYSVRNPENSTVLQQLASDAHQLGKSQKARRLYTKLIENLEVDDQILFQAVEVFDTPGYEKKRSTLLLEYLKRHPNYMPFRQELVKFYIENNEFEAALYQLRYLSDNIENNDNFLLEAGTLCQRDLKRPDKALLFFDRYSQKHPEDIEIKQKIIQIQSGLAKDFLSIVENDGAKQLWKDLAEITSNRRDIFLEMSALLEKKGQTDALIEVLTIIYQHSTPEDTLALRISQQYNRIGQYGHTLEYLNAVTTKEYRTRSYFLFKGETEQHLGLEMEALVSFEQGLSFDPRDLGLRAICLKLAGKIGDIPAMIALFHTAFLQNEDVSLDFVLTYLDLLSYNFLFSECEKTDLWARKKFADSPESLSRLDAERVSSLQREGKTRRAEQLLRQLLTNSTSIEDILFQLTENALLDKKLRDAESWYQALQRNLNQEDTNFSYDFKGCRMLLLKVKILKAQGEYGTALTLIENYQKGMEKRSVSKELKSFMVDLEKQHCLLSFYNGDFLEASSQSRELLVHESFDPELFVLQNMIHRKLKNYFPDNYSKNMINVDGNPVLTRLLAVAEVEINFQEYKDAEKHLAVVLAKMPSSVVGDMLWVELMTARGQGDSALQSLSQLIQRFPEEQYFTKKRIEVESRRGRYAQALDFMRKDSEKVAGIDELTLKLISEDNIEELLTLARLLWGDKQQEKALQIYSAIINSFCTGAIERKI